MPFILDTGASATVIDRRQAENLGFALGGGGTASTGGGEIEASEINGVTHRDAAGVSGTTVGILGGEAARELTLEQIRELFRKDGQVYGSNFDAARPPGALRFARGGSCK